MAAANECSRVIHFDDLYDTPEYVAGILFVLEDVYIFEEDTIAKVVAARADDVLYGFDSAALMPEFYEELNAVGNFMKKNPGTKAIITGYADSV